MTASSGVGRRVRNWVLAWLALAAVGLLVFQPGAGADPGADDQLYGDGETIDIRDRAEQSGIDKQRDIPHLALREPPATVTFEFDPTLAEDVRTEIRGAVGLADAYFRATGAGGLPTVSVVASADPAYLARAVGEPRTSGSSASTEEFWDDFQGMYFGGTVFIRADWPSEGYDWNWQREEVISIVVHEMAHAVHDDLADGVQMRHLIPGLAPEVSLPTWFLEGAAEVEATTALQAFGFAAFAAERESRISGARQVRETLASSQSETGDAYVLGFLAVANLTDDGDLAKMRDVFTGMASGRSFEESFVAALGQGINDFVRGFEEVRAQDFPPYRGVVRGSVRVDGSRASTLMVWACSDDDVCSSAAVDRDGTFSLVVADGRYRLEFSSISDREYNGLSVYYSLDGPVSNYEDATVFSVFGDTVEGFELEIPVDMFED